MQNLVNQTLPQLDFIGTYTLNGRGGTGLMRDPQDPVNIINTIPGGYIDALGGHRHVRRADLERARPVRASARGQRAESQRGAAAAAAPADRSATSRPRSCTIATDVTTAALAIRNSLEAMQAATAARELSVKRLEAAQSKFEVGMSNNFEVLQAQRDLADARNRELRETLNYQRALVDFERAQISPR